MLDPSQHGLRAKHGTDSASLLLVDALEHAKETHSACLVSSWNIRRAFDSISKPALQMAWTRLGVPPEWASFLIQLDFDGTTTVCLPISQMPTIAPVSLASTVSKPWEPPISSSQLHAVSPRGTSLAHLAGMPSMILSSVHEHYNVALYQTLPLKP